MHACSVQSKSNHVSIEFIRSCHDYISFRDSMNMQQLLIFKIKKSLVFGIRIWGVWGALRRVKPVGYVSFEWFYEGVEKLTIQYVSIFF